MQAMILFWIITAILSTMACCFFLPWVHRYELKLLGALFIGAAAYGCYYHLGESLQLPIYYSEEAIVSRKNDKDMRILLSTLGKKEFLLQTKLDDNPNDVETRWNLLNIMGIRAYQTAHYQEAIECWKQALLLIPNTQQQMTLRNMIERLIVNAEIKG